MNEHISGAASNHHQDDLNEDSRESVLRRFSDRLESVRLAAGRPSYAKLQAIVEHLRPPTISTVLQGKTNPKLDFVLHFVRACAIFAYRAGHPISVELVDEDGWRNNWLQTQRQLGALRRSNEPESNSVECAAYAFARAYQRLPPGPQAFFRVLSLQLAPEFNLRTAAELLDIPQHVMLRHLETLIDAGLAERFDDDCYRIRDLLDGLPADFPIQRDRRSASHCQQCVTRR